MLRAPNPFNFYSCGLSTTTIEYSSLSVCLCVCVSVCVHDNSKNNGSIHLKLDLCEYKKKQYLIVIDYYSRWMEIKQLTSTTSRAVIEKTKTMFISFGVPDIIISDNGPQYSSQEFKKFCSDWNICHRPVNPHFPQENGMAERAVQTAKQILDLPDPEIGLLNYRATLHSATGISPSLALLGREIQTRLPVLSKVLLPRSVKPEEIRAADKSAKQRYKQYYDDRYGARNLPVLPQGEPVLVKLDNEKKWTKQGDIVQSDPVANRSYLVQTEDGVFRRNRKHLQNVPADPTDPVETKDPINVSSDPKPPELVPKPTPVPKQDVPPVQYTRSGRAVYKPARYKD